MLSALIEAAEAARKASVDSCHIEIIVTEIGLVVRGKRGHHLHPKAASQEISWEELDAALVPNLISNAVALVSIGLRR